jgi:diacylglycerol kinase
MKRFIKSVGYAINGWRLFFAEEKNGQLQIIAAIAVIILGFTLHIGLSEWQIILLCIVGVLTLEMMNSALEKVIDLMHPEQHPEIKWIKDVAAGAVLLAAIASAIIGVIIFLPKIIIYLGR